MASNAPNSPKNIPNKGSNWASGEISIEVTTTINAPTPAQIERILCNHFSKRAIKLPETAKVAIRVVKVSIDGFNKSQA